MGRKFNESKKKKSVKGKRVPNTGFVDSKGRRRSVRHVRSPKSGTSLYFVGVDE